MATRNPSLNMRPELLQTAAMRAAGGGDGTGDWLMGVRGAQWWTGKHPTQCPGFDAQDGTLHSLPLPNTSKFTRQSVLDYFDNCWTLTEVRRSNGSHTGRSNAARARRTERRARVQHPCARAEPAAAQQPHTCA